MDSDSSRSVALFSIHPEYANAIMAGTKRVEFRKTKLVARPEFVVVYATSPVQKIVGYFSVPKVATGSPKTVWKKYRAVGGISYQKFHDYYADSIRAVAIEVGDVHSLVTPLPLADLGKGIKPPQSFQYLPKESFLRLFGQPHDAPSLSMRAAG